MVKSKKKLQERYNFMKQKFAVFDIDGTLYRWQLYHDLVQTLALEEVLPETSFQDLDEQWNRWRGGEIGFDAYENFVVNVMVESLPHIPVAAFEAACDAVIERSAHKLHHYSRALLMQLKKQGYTIIAITGSQQELIDRFALRYSIDIAIGALYQRDGDHFTGIISRPTIGQKANILRELVTTHELSYEGSVAIGDSDGDAAILELVEQPIAFNPSEGLFNTAKENGWPIVIERKNIAYRLESRGDELVLADTIIY